MSKQYHTRGSDVHTEYQKPNHTFSAVLCSSFDMKMTISNETAATAASIQTSLASACPAVASTISSSSSSVAFNGSLKDADWLATE